MLKLFRYAWDVDPTEHFLKIARRLTDYPDKNSSPDIASMKRQPGIEVLYYFEMKKKNKLPLY